MLKNAPLIVKIGVDTEENEPKGKSDASRPNIGASPRKLAGYSAGGPNAGVDAASVEGVANLPALAPSGEEADLADLRRELNN